MKTATPETLPSAVISAFKDGGVGILIDQPIFDFSRDTIIRVTPETIAIEQKGGARLRVREKFPYCSVDELAGNPVYIGWQGRADIEGHSDYVFQQDNITVVFEEDDHGRQS